MKKILSFTTALSLFAGMTAFPVNAEDTAVLKDSGINYTEKVGTIANPACGYTSTVWPVCKPNSTPVYSPTANLVLFFIDIGAFSSGTNGTTAEDGTYTEGTDYDLDDTFFTSWRTTFENCRKNGCTVALRFRYDANGKDNPEPSSFEQVLKHISQIKESGLLDEYKDIIAYVESGFVGKWGEQHGGKYTSVEYKAQLLDAMLDCVPAPIPVTVRTPDIFAKWAGITRSELADFSSEGIENAYRVGLYDDGYMGSDSDLGTYANREIEITWLSNQTKTSYFGGEFSGNLEWAKKYNTYLPENAIPEMYKSHLSYINGNIFQLYKDYTFNSNYDVEGVDNSAYYGQNVFQFIRDHIGYRFVLRKSELSETVKQGDTLDLNFSIENTGFANLIPSWSTHTEIILEKDGNFIRANAENINPNNWDSCSVTDIAETVKLPDSLQVGDWNVYLKVSLGENDLSQISLRSVQFANEDVYNSILGANYLGTFTVTDSESHGTDNKIYTSSGGNDVNVYSFAGQTTVDGRNSSAYEWSEDMKLAENQNGQDLYLKADDKYIYVKSTMPTGSSAPVYNIQFKNAETDESFWLYYASNGFVYFNHDSYAGCMCKWENDTVEFRLPFEIIGMKSGDKLKNLRVFLQDSGDSWKLMGDISTPECVIPTDFMVYSAVEDMRLKEGESEILTAETPVENVSYQWYKDGKLIEGANSKEYALNSVSAESKGIYSVEIKTESGLSKTVDIANVIEVLAYIPVYSETTTTSTSSAETKTTETTTVSVVLETLYGDANYDGKITLADCVAVLQYVANKEKYPLSEQGLANADVSGDNDGITGMDALKIQQYDSGIISSFK